MREVSHSLFYLRSKSKIIFCLHTSSHKVKLKSSAETLVFHKSRFSRLKILRVKTLISVVGEKTLLNVFDGRLTSYCLTSGANY